MNLFSNSLINKIKFLGFILVLLILFILFIAYKTSTLNTKKTYIHHAIKISELLNTSNSELNEYLINHNIKTSKYEDISKLIRSSKSLITDSLIRKTFSESGIKLYKKNNHVLFVLKNRKETLYFQSSSSFLSTTILPIILSAILLFLIMYGIYHYIKNAFSPLIRLEKNIKHFYKAEDIDIKYENANDEIANIANAFYSAIEHNKKLKAQKDMYICMVMHEISTPLTKAKFITHFMKDKEEKEKLNALFDSMQYELDKVYEFERINTKISAMKISIFSINSLIEDVCDVLLLDKNSIEIKEESVEKSFDYNLFIVAIKNLVDNALKYSPNSKVQIVINNTYLEIKNLSLNEESLNIKQLLKPFKQDSECNNGMGLGLFLTNEIISKHDFKLTYTFSYNYHIFRINFS